MRRWNATSDPRKSGVSLETLTHVTLFDEQISNFPGEVEWLHECKNLKNLMLTDTKIASVDGLSEFKSLTELNLSFNYIKSVAGLASLLNLTNLYLENNQIDSIAELRELKNLIFLNLKKNFIENMRSFSELTALKRLDLTFNKITTIEGLNNLSNLTTLYLSRNLIESVTGLQELKSLTDLDLSKNKIVKIQGVSGLTSLKTLNLSGNRIEKIEELTDLPNLKKLNLSLNLITHVPNILLILPKIENIDTFGNPIESCSPEVESFQIRRYLGRYTQYFYYDEENVMANSTTHSVRRNICSLLSKDNSTPFSGSAEVLDSILLDPVLSEETKKDLIKYSEDFFEELPFFEEVRLVDVLRLVWNRISSADPDLSTEIKRVLCDEMDDARDTCLTGVVSRIVNCLTGFFQDITFEINASEQLASMISDIEDELESSYEDNFYQVYYHRVTKMMTERGYTPAEIKVWMIELEARQKPLYGELIY